MRLSILALFALASPALALEPKDVFVVANWTVPASRDVAEHYLAKRGVPKEKFASQNWYDVWYPNLAPSVETMKQAQAAETPAQWSAFVKKFRAEMAQPDAARSLDVLAALSHHAQFSVGCYCDDEARCHRSVLRALLKERGADVA